MKIKRRVPNCFTVEEEMLTEHTVNTMEELQDLDWIKGFAEIKNHYGFFRSKNRNDYPDMLLTMSSYDEKYGGCKSWWVIGYILEDGGFDLPSTEGMYAKHVAGCPALVSMRGLGCTCGLNED